VVPADPESLVRFAELLKLRSLARTTQEEYLRYVRKLAARVGGNPAGIDEAQLRAHLLYLKDGTIIRLRRCAPRWRLCAPTSVCTWAAIGSCSTWCVRLRR
jgi:hypothetical protein